MCENSEKLKNFVCRKNEFGVKLGCLFWGSRVVIPLKLREKVLSQLHNCQPGVSPMKALSRSFVWWSNIDRGIENTVKSCRNCQMNKNNPIKAPIHPWEWTNKLSVRLHLDYAGPYYNKMFLIIVDSLSKWIDMIPSSSATSEETIKKLQTVFANFGLSEQIVTDNGSVFTTNGIQQIRTAPYHPASNDQAERTVQTFKTTLNKMLNEKGTINQKVQRFLMAYHTTPHSATNSTPAELLFGRRLRTALDILKPSLSNNIEKNHNSMICRAQNRRMREFSNGQEVFICNFGVSSRWISGVIVNSSGPLTWLIKLEDGKTVIRHADHI